MWVSRIEVVSTGDACQLQGWVESAYPRLAARIWDFFAPWRARRRRGSASTPVHNRDSSTLLICWTSDAFSVLIESG
jgi:hypothetical protein